MVKFRLENIVSQGFHESCRGDNEIGRFDELVVEPRIGFLFVNQNGIVIDRQGFPILQVHVEPRFANVARVFVFRVVIE